MVLPVPLFRWHSRSLRDLLPCHSGSALGALSFKTRCSCLVGDPFTTVWANTIPARACSKAATHAASASSAHASTGSRPLTPWASSVSSWHFYSPPCLAFLVFPILAVSLPSFLHPLCNFIHRHAAAMQASPYSCFQLPFLHDFFYNLVESLGDL